MRKYNKLIFELSKPGRKAYKLPPLDVEDKDISEFFPEDFINENPLTLPEVNEVEVIRHYTNLSDKNFGLDTGFYPLGSCTMKYNPKINENTARLDGFANIHPRQREGCTQGALQLMYELQNSLAEVAGMDQMTLQPAAGAHGELAGIMVIKAYHEKNGDTKRDTIIVPDSAHGTNPATATMAGYKIVEVKSTENGRVDVEALRNLVGENTAGLMLTNPNTLGLFESDIKEIAKIVHDAGGQLYYDGANANAILGQARPGDMGFDVVHFNIHKTFSTPHGGGGPGSGPVGVKAHLTEFLPVPIVGKEGDRYFLDYNIENTIGKVKDFYGHFGILVRAYTYILTMGRDGLKKASEMAVLNANYMLSKLKDDYYLPIDALYKHEFVLSGLKGNSLEVTTLDIAKRLLDFGFHPPTVYFPLIINQAMMIEPTETESLETLDEFIDALLKIAKEAKEDVSILKTAPHDTLVRRPDETKAARSPVVTYKA
ncbi:aminomethyl-transferring glycine dehydrogenase subunit GcvPB [Tissierella creatinophila]|uniref:Probable glycine dehydrogenase (decarboxylating) subunit 2 n=1 Tax=Tissierella creatinophila DSM 6911 TaxID=1123403 RepID=A0A1U7M461_TISCR|nr:aminomethyl-transferring glycine dehydrogenase subunit GcvPB [Tissierella creatinophila]OLS02104.1 putative glycine dehydrogenase (decarboxylating) subunit 2 [Tissierella creatinophila DSM 6911]